MTLYLSETDFNAITVENNPRILFIYDDDVLHTRRYDIKDMSNAFGFPTRHRYTIWIWSHFSDDQLNDNINIIDDYFNQVYLLLLTQKYKGICYISRGLGIHMKIRAPKTYDYINNLFTKATTNMKVGVL